MDLWVILGGKKYQAQISYNNKKRKVSHTPPQLIVPFYYFTFQY